MRVNQAMERRVLREAEYIAATGATVRKTASVLGVSKSTVHKDMESRLAALSAPLHKEVAAVMAKNKAERHLRGGEATRRRYAKGNDGASPSHSRASAPCDFRHAFSRTAGAWLRSPSRELSSLHLLLRFALMVRRLSVI